MASSRGKGLKPLIQELHPNPDKLVVTWTPGGSLERIQDYGYKHVMDSDDPTNCHVYYFAGLCDITYFDRDPEYNEHERYEEVLIKDSTTDIVNRVTETIDNISRHTLFLAAKPVFCPILTCSIKDWNITRCDQNRTSFLLHHNSYEDMQFTLNQSIRQLNSYIVETNLRNDAITPFLENTIMTRSSLAPPRIHYDRFTDGVHPREKLRKKWDTRLFNAMKANQVVPTNRAKLIQDEFPIETS